MRTEIMDLMTVFVRKTPEPLPEVLEPFFLFVLFLSFSFFNNLSYPVSHSAYFDLLCQSEATFFDQLTSILILYLTFPPAPLS